MISFQQIITNQTVSKFKAAQNTVKKGAQKN